MSLNYFNIDQLLIWMNEICTVIKDGELTTDLANNIFVLCQQLKIAGQHLEQLHKSKLKRQKKVFKFF